MSDYPEHEKMKAVAKESEAIGEFLDSAGYDLCELKPTGRRDGLGEDQLAYTPVMDPINVILARYFKIDLNKIEDEKRAMLDSMRGANS